MFTFCDVLHDAKQTNINKLSRVRSTDWKSALRDCAKDVTLTFCKQTTTEFEKLCSYSPEPRNEIHQFRPNFNMSKLVYL